MIVYLIYPCVVSTGLRCFEYVNLIVPHNAEQVNQRSLFATPHIILNNQGYKYLGCCNHITPMMQRSERRQESNVRRGCTGFFGVISMGETRLRLSTPMPSQSSDIWQWSSLGQQKRWNSWTLKPWSWWPYTEVFTLSPVPVDRMYSLTSWVWTIHHNTEYLSTQWWKHQGQRAEKGR